PVPPLFLWSGLGPSRTSGRGREDESPLFLRSKARAAPGKRGLGHRSQPHTRAIGPDFRLLARDSRGSRGATFLFFPLDRERVDARPHRLPGLFASRGSQGGRDESHALLGGGRTPRSPQPLGRSLRVASPQLERSAGPE